MVENAIITSMPSNESLWLPGYVSVIYSCVRGFYMENPDDNAAKCVYYFQKDRRPHEYRPPVITAIWTGQNEIHCIAG